MRKTTAVRRRRLAVLTLLVVLGTSASCGSVEQSALSTMPAGSPVLAGIPPLAPAALERTSKRTLSPVYWLGENDGTVYLYREFHDLEQVGDPIVAALKLMLAGKPDDPDYFSLWRPATALGASIDEKNLITIDISRDALAATMDAGLAERSIQQLVFTATAAAANAGILTGSAAPSVRLLVDGQPGHRAFGRYELPGTITRDEARRAPLWIIEPQQDAVLGNGKVRVSGSTADFSGGTHWQLERRGDTSPDTSPDTAADATGHAAVISNGQFDADGTKTAKGSFDFEQVLEPGDYLLSVWGLETGHPERLALDTREFRVG